MKYCKFLILAALALPTLAFAQATDKPASKPDTGTEQAIMKMEQDLITALIKGDVGAIGPMVADTFFFTAPDGKTSSKAQFLADVKSGDLKILSSAIKDMKVQASDSDMAVVTYATTDKGTYKGEDISGEYRWTDVFMKRDGGWELSVSQGTGIDAAKP
ncbi:MAG: nuclear transport factor 2 family protein [Verrucomicrobiota bacterium]